MGWRKSQNAKGWQEEIFRLLAFFIWSVVMIMRMFVKTQSLGRARGELCWALGLKGSSPHPRGNDLQKISPRTKKLENSSDGPDQGATRQGSCITR